jgi:hypothetical protein
MKSRKTYSLCIPCDNDIKTEEAKKMGKFFCRGCRNTLDLIQQQPNSTRCIKCYNEVKEPTKQVDENIPKCKAVIEQGKKKGDRCTYNATENGYCLKHKNQAILLDKPQGFIKCDKPSCINEAAKDRARCEFHLAQARESDRKRRGNHLTTGAPEPDNGSAAMAETTQFAIKPVTVSTMVKKPLKIMSKITMLKDIKPTDPIQHNPEVVDTKDIKRLRYHI